MTFVITEILITSVMVELLMTFVITEILITSVMVECI